VFNEFVQNQKNSAKEFLNFLKDKLEQNRKDFLLSVKIIVFYNVSLILLD